MKKNNISKMIFLGLFIILIIMVILLIFSNRSKDLTKAMYNDVCNKGTYTFAMQEEGKDLDYKLTISKKDESICIDSNTNGEHTATLVEQGVTYYILHNEKEYYYYDSSETDADILKEDLSDINESQYKKGHEKINGKDYYYEEYDGISAFAVALSYNEESDIKTRFYYDGKNIAYIKTIINGEEELLKAEFSDIIDEEMFKIPDDYAEK